MHLRRTGNFSDEQLSKGYLEREKCMDVNKLAGACLIILAIVNVLHEFVVRSTGRGEPGLLYAAVTALFFTFGVVLLLRKGADHSKRAQRAKGPSIFSD
jgi:hypothetical protein